MEIARTSKQATVADLYAVDGNAELVDGNLVRMPPTGGRPSYAASEIFVSLRLHARRTGAGLAVTDGAGFLVNLPNRRSFSPDAAFWTGADPAMKFFDGAPAFAVEVRSESDYGPAAERAIARKRADYFLAGTQVVWEVDLTSRTEVVVAWVSDADVPASRWGRGEIARAEPAVPGWSMSVDDLFPGA